MLRTRMAGAGNWEVRAGVTHGKSERCRGQMSRGIRLAAYLRARKTCILLSKIILEEHNRPCPWTTH